MRRLDGDVFELDLWTPRDVSTVLGIDYKTGLQLVKRLKHLKAGRRYLVSRSVVLREFGLDANGTPLPVEAAQ